jgi:hypothetical protein
VRQQRGLWVAAAAVLVVGCAGPGFRLSDLPDAPLAIVYRTVAETDQIRENLQDARTRVGTSRQEVHLRDLAAAVGLSIGGENPMAGLLGRLALVDPHTGAVTVAPFAERGAQPQDWSPDHRRLLFRSDRLGTPQIFEWNARSQDVHPVTSSNWKSLAACYGPGGEIAVVRNGDRSGRQVGSRIYLLAPGNEPRRLTDGPADGRPRFSPDGRLLVFNTVDDAGQPAIGSVDVATGEAHHLLARGRDATFTPDGAWIFYTQHMRDGWKVWQMRPDGSAKHPFGLSPYNEYEPAVSPDGRFLIYLATRKEVDPDSILMVRSLANGRDRALVIDGTAIDPIW